MGNLERVSVHFGSGWTPSFAMMKGNLSSISNYDLDIMTLSSAHLSNTVAILDSNSLILEALIRILSMIFLVQGSPSTTQSEC